MVMPHPSSEPQPMGLPGLPEGLREVRFDDDGAPQAGPPIAGGPQPSPEEAIADPRPRITTPTSLEVELPGGFFDRDQVLHTRARVRELTGEDEEALAQYNWNKDMAAYITALVSRAVVSVGPHPMTMEMARLLYMGDRDSLVLGIRKATFGDEVPIELYCPTCDVKTDVFFDINTDIPVKKLDDPNKRLYEVELRDGHQAKVVFPTGEVHERAIASNKNDAESNTLMLSLCVKTLDDDDFITAERVRRLGIADRRTLLSFIFENQPGPRMTNLEAPCHRCNRGYPVAFTIGDIFR